MRCNVCICCCLAASAVLLAIASSAAVENGKAGFSPAEFQRHIEKLKKKVPNGDFTIVVASPFVVLGDGAPGEVRRCARETVQWAVDKLKDAYFSKDPPEILDIWLFKDESSYNKYSKTLFQTKSDTPYGYYSHADRALIMNIATGGGTLVHEIVHPYISANFPECPSWFNEGLASLYEQSGEDGGRICGYTNWRLPSLQKAIRNHELPSFESLCAMTHEEFYDKDRGTNYAQARYLCYYLQEEGLLRDFYRRFRADCQEDPTGYRTLRQVLDRKDMKKFQSDWEAFVLKLRFR